MLNLLGMNSMSTKLVLGVLLVAIGVIRHTPLLIAAGALLLGAALVASVTRRTT